VHPFLLDQITDQHDLLAVLVFLFLANRLACDVSVSLRCAGNDGHAERNNRHEHYACVCDSVFAFTSETGM
jgi:hypothetical protein